MIKQIKKQFILFNLVVIGSTTFIICALVFLFSDHKPLRPSIFLFSLICIFFSYIAALILSRVAIKPIKEAWQRQLDFTADASHELRTPLTIIQTNLEIILDSPEETIESQKKWLDNIVAEQQRMTQLVNDLLILSRADNGTQKNIKEDIYLNELLMELEKKFAPVCVANRLEFSVNASIVSPFHGDYNRLTQLFIILLDNAVHYTKEGGTIRVSLERNEKNYIVKVSDTGIGIENEELSHIFHRFYRSIRTRGLHPEGSGLGLPIAKLITEEHGGTISVKSIVNDGTTFIVKLPCQL